MEIKLSQVQAKQLHKQLQNFVDSSTNASDEFIFTTEEIDYPDEAGLVKGGTDMPGYVAPEDIPDSELEQLFTSIQPEIDLAVKSKVLCECINITNTVYRYLEMYRYRRGDFTKFMLRLINTIMDKYPNVIQSMKHISPANIDAELRGGYANVSILVHMRP